MVKPSRLRGTARRPAPGSPAACRRSASRSSRATAARAAANERSMRVARKDTRLSSTASWRSANSLTITARNSASSGARQRHHRQRAQPRGEIGHLDPPGRRRAARGDQHIGALLAREIEQMKQRGFVEAAFGEILEHQRAGGERDRNIGAVERARRQRPRARLRAPRSPRDGFCRSLPVRAAAPCATASPASARSARAPRRWTARRENPRARGSRRDRAQARAASARSWPAVRPWRPGPASISAARRSASGVDRAFQIFAERKAKQHADGRRERHRDQQSDEAEQVAERDQRKHHPDRMQPDLGPTSLGEST